MIKSISSCTALLLSFAAGAFSQTTSVLVGAGYSEPDPPLIAPGQVVTLYYRAIGPLPNGQPRSAKAADTPLPALLAGLSAQIIQQQSLWNVPISDVSQQNVCDAGAAGPACLLTSVKIQIPFEIMADAARDPQSGSVTLSPPAVMNLYADGNLVAATTVQPVPDNAHVLTNCDTAGTPQAGTVCGRIAFHRDGSSVDAASPAAKGEAIGVLLYGLGQTSPAATTGDAAQPGYMVTTVLGAPHVTATLTPFGNSIASSPRGAYYPQPGEVPAVIDNAALLAGKVGVYEVNIRVPSSLSPPIACRGSIRSNYILTLITSQGAERIPVCVVQ